MGESAVPLRASKPLSLRASEPLETVMNDLGPLRELPGTWVGGGFNLISVPTFSEPTSDGNIFRPLPNLTQETLTFRLIGGAIPNRGSHQNDIFFPGLHYLQQVSDMVSHGGMHFETGFLLNVPATKPPVAKGTVVRLATVPHGVCLLAQGKSNPRPSKGPPAIAPVSSTPTHIDTGQPMKDRHSLAPFGKAQKKRGIPRKAIGNPNLVLTEAIKHQTIVRTVTINVKSTNDGGILSIPFINENARVTQFEATFWIEKVLQPDHERSYFMQLQYSQKVMLRFAGLDWPHISVATLVKQ
jgi:hypothetical protein